MFKTKEYICARDYYLAGLKAKDDEYAASVADEPYQEKVLMDFSALYPDMKNLLFAYSRLEYLKDWIKTFPTMYDARLEHTRRYSPSRVNGSLTDKDYEEFSLLLIGVPDSEKIIDRINRQSSRTVFGWYLANLGNHLFSLFSPNAWLQYAIYKVEKRYESLDNFRRFHAASKMKQYRGAFEVSSAYVDGWE